MDQDTVFLNKAFEYAKKAYQKQEVPVGAIVVANGQIVGVGYNKKESQQQAFAHAECLAIQRASRKMQTWRLSGCVLYTTLEPCPMCTGLILQSRMARIVYGAQDLKWGAAGTVVDLTIPSLFNHAAEWVYLEQRQCQDILTTFFKEKR